MLKRIFAILIIFYSLNGFAQFGFERYDSVEVYKSSISQKYPWVGGMDYCQFSNIDLDFDGTDDLFIFDRTCNKVLTFIQTGAVGTTDFEYAPEYEADFPAELHDWALLVDYNCDGKKDIYTYTLGGIKVWENTGSVGSGLSFVEASSLLESWLWGSYGILYTSSIDIPSIVDIDGDSDIDILVFSLAGTTVEYHKNLSMETYGVCDSLVYENKNRCWGRFRESGVSNLLTLWDTLTDPCDEDPLIIEEMVIPDFSDRADRHSGSSLTALDMNGSGVMDLVLGDISYNGLILLNNSGASPNLNSGMDAQFPNYPMTSIAVDVPVFPALYHVDINNDGIRDAIVTPNSPIGAENRVGSWWYDNIGADNNPDFQFVQDDFLQGGMIDQGSGSLPIFFDHNGDSLMDLLVSCFGLYDAGNLRSQIAYYENTGTLSDPEFTFVTDDYMGIGQLGIGSSLVFYPTFGDLDNDGDEDMILGEFSGELYYMENTGGAGNPAIFTTYVVIQDDTSNPIDNGIYPFPTVVDLDRDDDLDLVIGGQNGKLIYYDNIGTISAPIFQLINSDFGGVDVSEFWTTQGFSVPSFIDTDTSFQLVIGSDNGFLHYYDSIEGNLAGIFNLVDSTLEDINIGTRSAPAIYNIDDDDRLEMVLGNQRGGLGFYKTALISQIGLNENEMNYELNIYPNPAEDFFNIDLGDLSQSDLKDVTIQLFDMSGRLIRTLRTEDSIVQIETGGINAGTYLVFVTRNSDNVVRKVVIR